MHVYTCWDQGKEIRDFDHAGEASCGLVFFFIASNALPIDLFERVSGPYQDSWDPAQNSSI